VRDGKPYAPRSGGIRAPARNADALAKLRAAASQHRRHQPPDVSKGRSAGREAIHAHLLKKLPIDAVKACFHTDSEGCACRKPKPGMLLEAATEFGIDLAASYLVGDRWRDVAAAQAAGCKALFIDYQYDEKRPEKPYVAVKSLPEAAGYIVRADP
jgi:D-glycero-D-manno-heptose 1,7-bisphosphate phosphatase